MNTIISVLESINKASLKVYLGNGEISELSVTLNQGLDIDAIEQIMPNLPTQYKELLTFSNGLCFFNSGDYTLYPLEDAIEYQKANDFNKNILPIGYFLDETILLNCAESETEHYLYAGSSIMKDEFISLDMDLRSFLDKLLANNCNCFWLEKPVEKYYNFN